MVKEYGGYLPLELSKGRPYYTGEDVIALNAGRYAITYAIEDDLEEKMFLGSDLSHDVYIGITGSCAFCLRNCG